MSLAFARTDTSVIGRWWWTVDRWTLIAIAALAITGTILTLASSPAVATRIGYDPFYFVTRQMIYLPMALGVMFAVSLLEPRTVRRLAVAVFILALTLTAMTLLVGLDTKGARRWLHLGALSIQPSEFVKPAFAVVAAWMFAAQRQASGIPGNLLSILLLGLIASILYSQPDFGMLVVVVAVWLVQFYLAGLRIQWVVLFGVLGIVGVIGAYLTLPHVALRIDHFFNPQQGDTYQIDHAKEAFSNGGLFGRGPGEGVAKLHLPDAHSDFVFAVAGEEFGLVSCLVIIGVFAFVLLRGLGRMLQEENLFIMLAGTGLLVQFGLQACINMASAMQMMPTKGMTLPFISYGGSSLLALALGMGMVLALTRKRVGPGELA
jgi:cell division protein FtsW